VLSSKASDVLLPSKTVSINILPFVTVIGGKADGFNWSFLEQNIGIIKLAAKLWPRPLSAGTLCVMPKKPRKKLNPFRKSYIYQKTK
jgi:hypothetical protein